VLFKLFRWLYHNLSTLLLAFFLAVVVWVSAVVAADPNEERQYPRQVQLEVIGLDPGLMVVDTIPTQVRLTLNAPRSIWEQLESNPDLVRAWIDLAGLRDGEHTLPIKTQVSLTPHQVVRVSPSEVTLTLEKMLTRSVAVHLVVSGDPALGYRKGAISVLPEQVTISGPESEINLVKEVRVELDIAGANATVRRTLAVQALDNNDMPVAGVTISPPSVAVTQVVALLGGYRNVVVKVVTNGEVAEGYWLTNISVSPPNVTVFSSNPELVNQLPGYVETEPLDLTGASDDFDVRVTLALPGGVTLVGEESVLVRVGIASIEGSLTISLPLELVGLPPEFQAIVSPETVDVIFSGPLPILNNLKPTGLRVSLNLTGLELGIHQVTPVVDLLPAQVKVESILPETLEVQIIRALTPTTTSASGPAASPAPTPTPTPKATPTPAP